MSNYFAFSQQVKEVMADVLGDIQRNEGIAKLAVEGNFF